MHPVPWAKDKGTSTAASSVPATADRAISTIGVFPVDRVAFAGRERTKIAMIGAMEASSSDLYQAILTLSRSIAGHTDLESLLSGAAEPLRQIVGFDYLAMILHDADRKGTDGYILYAPAGVENLRLPVDQDPAGWVWLHQQPLVIPSLEGESRWPEFVERARAAGVRALTLVPLTAGDNRLGAFGFGCPAPYQPSPAEITFLERVASEFAVAVEAFFAKQHLVRERDSLGTLFDITNALVSKLPPDELFPAISEQLCRVIKHDFAVLMLCNEEIGRLDRYALHSIGSPLVEVLRGPFSAVGMPAAEVLATGKPVVAYDTDVDRYPSPLFRRFVAQGFKSVCSVPVDHDAIAP